MKEFFVYCGRDRSALSIVKLDLDNIVMVSHDSDTSNIESSFHLMVEGNASNWFLDVGTLTDKTDKTDVNKDVLGIINDILMVEGMIPNNSVELDHSKDYYEKGSIKKHNLIFLYHLIQKIDRGLSYV